jgi:hypothetical protein
MLRNETNIDTMTVGSMGDTMYNGIPIIEVVDGSIHEWKLPTAEEARKSHEDRLAYKASVRLQAIRELAEMIALGGDPVALAVQCVEALEDMGWSDD